MELTSRTTMANERRWIILGDDGRHVTVGRHSNPTERELHTAAESLEAIGVGGWLALAEGGFHRAEPLCMTMVRELAQPRRSWEAAVEAFHQARRVSPARSTL